MNPSTIAYRIGVALLVQCVCVSLAWAESNVAIECHVDGSRISGTCESGATFRLRCMDANYETEVDCPEDPDAQRTLCNAGCRGVASGEGTDPQKGDGMIAVTSTQGNGVDVRPTQTVDVRAQRRKAAKRGQVPKGSRHFVGRSRKGSLVMYHHVSDRIGETVTWQYRHRRGAVLDLVCHLDDEACYATLNGRRVEPTTMPRYAIGMANDANQLMGQFQVSSLSSSAADAICYAAGIGAGFWPIGTLIAGPTALGCLVMYALED